MEEHIFNSWADYRTSARALLDTAQSTLWIQDADLSALELESLEMHACFKACVMRLRHGGLRMVLQTGDALCHRMPRTRRLLVDYAHVAQVRVAAERDREAMECAIILADGREMLTRPQHTLPRGVLMTDAPGRANRQTAQFETIWEAASDANIGAVLGL